MAGTVADAVEQVLASGRLPVVLGGDCTITLGVMAGVLRHHPQAGLLYVDGDGVVVHFDVDAVDSRDLPLANYPHYGLGVPLAVAAEVLPVFYRVPRLRAAVFTEVNPSYDPSGVALARYVDAVAGSLAGALSASP